MTLVDGARLLRHHLRPQRGALWRLAAWSGLEAAPPFLAGILVATAIDRGFLQGRPLLGLGWLAGLAALWTVGALATRQAYPWLAAAVEPLRDSLVTALVRASLGQALLDERADGSSVSQATVQVETVRALVSTLLRTIRQMVVAALATVGGLAMLSPSLALVVSGFLVVALALFAALMPVLFTRYRAAVLAEEQVTARTAPVVTGIRDVVVAGAEERVAGQVGVAIEAEVAADRALARARAWRLPVVTLGAHLPLLALLALAPGLVADGHLTVGQVVGGVYYLVSGLEPAIALLVNAGATIFVSLGVVLTRLAEVCAEPPAAPPAAPGAAPAGHDLALAGVSFAYSPHAEPVVVDLTLDVPEGAHLAVVGPSGVGKSTLANLMARLATPQRGTLSLGGMPLEAIDEAHLRRTVALIPQEAYIFAGTLRENLVYLSPRATGDEIEAAAAAVGLEPVITRLGGVDGEIQPGGGALSPGERQLIALVRVHLSAARVVILDEATCHLDPAAEARAEEAFARRHGTLVVIAHRISSALRAERVLVMDGAEPLLGTHRDLCRDSPVYAGLVGHWGVARSGPAVASAGP